MLFCTHTGVNSVPQQIFIPGLNIDPQPIITNNNPTKPQNTDFRNNNNNLFPIYTQPSNNNAFKNVPSATTANKFKNEYIPSNQQNINNNNYNTIKYETNKVISPSYYENIGQVQTPYDTSKFKILTESFQKYDNSKYINSQQSFNNDDSKSNSAETNTFYSNNNNNNNNQAQLNTASKPKSIEYDITDCFRFPNKRSADSKYCNMYHLCSEGIYTPLLCPENYFYSTETQKCEHNRKVECASRLAVTFDHSNVPFMDSPNGQYQKAPRIINGTLECPLGSDGYYADPEFCNLYHHCLAGVDYAEQCPHQLVWNDRKKMCDWQTNVNCTNKIIPVAQGQTSFCTDKVDNKYKDPIYCNVFHHCIGGIDNVVRCDGELMWNEKEMKCDWESKVKCTGKMLPSEKHYNSTFCINKSDGPYAHDEYCNVYHVCESGTDNIRQCPNQLFWDSQNKRCDWSGKVECTGRTLVTLSTDTTLFCMERKDGVYGDTTWCNVYHNCLSGVDFKTKCPENLVWNDTKKDCDWSDSTQCITGNYFKEGSDPEKKTFCSDKQNGKYPHEVHCNRYYVCQNGKDIIFTCQNNLRYNEAKQECDWAVNIECNGKQDYMWEGIKDNFCKGRVSFCNLLK